MGGRVTANLRNLSQYRIAYVEASPERQKEMAAGGIETTPFEQALDKAEVVVLAVPDRLIGRITQEVVPKLKPGTIVVGLDPAAAYAEIMPKREDITYLSLILVIPLCFLILHRLPKTPIGLGERGPCRKVSCALSIKAPRTIMPLVNRSPPICSRPFLDGTG